MIAEQTALSATLDRLTPFQEANIRVDEIELELKSLPPVVIEPEHIFSDGIYGRKIIIPAGTMLTGKMHRLDHINHVVGDISVWSESEGIRRITGHETFVAKAGTRRVGYAHSDTWWVTFHATKKTILSEIEEELIISNPSDLLKLPESIHPPKKRSGIYLIRNTINGRMYVGSSNQIMRRWNDHCSTLSSGKHGNQRLQNAWFKYGRRYFVFNVLEYVEDISRIHEREQYWMDLLAPYYNITPSAGSRKGMKWTKEQCAKLSVAQKGRVISQATRDKISAALKGTRHSPESYRKQSEKIRGRKLSEETKTKLSIAHKGIVFTPEHRAKIGRSNSGKKQSPETLAKLSLTRRGRILSAEHRAKISAANMGRVHPPESYVKMTTTKKLKKKLLGLKNKGECL